MVELVLHLERVAAGLDRISFAIARLADRLRERSSSSSDDPGKAIRDFEARNKGGRPV